MLDGEHMGVYNIINYIYTLEIFYLKECNETL